MTRFAWLQSRTQTLVVGGLIGALAIALAITGIHLSHIYHSLVPGCSAHGDCDVATQQFTLHYGFLQNALELLLRLAPALIGIFWGGPLIARELETGTYRLAWTQTVSRRRWVLTKLALVGGAAILAAGVLTLTITWWYRALDSLNDSQWGVFDARDLVPIGYTFFAFMAGAAFGAIIKRTVPAMATSLSVFVFARIAIQLWVRPHFMAARHLTTSLANAEFGFFSRNGGPVDLVVKSGGPRGSWVINSQLINSSGAVATHAERVAFVAKYCPQIAAGPINKAEGQHVRIPVDVQQSFESCHQHVAQSFHALVTYQPASHYWPFQWMELGVYVLLGLIAAATCFWWVTKRIV
jgi:ABC-type transport system involved in multi-copper enzyme maturation permease subunit